MNTHSPLYQRKSTWWISLLVLLTLSLAACAPAATPTQAVIVPAATNTVAVVPTNTVAPAATVPAATAPAATETTVASVPSAEPVIKAVDDTKLGKILVDEKGMTLYMFTKDGPDQSNCNGGCLKAWPPLVTQGSPKAGEGVDAAMLGTATMADGSKIVTYNKMPLYYWAQDTKPGDVTGQGVNNVWYVVAPDGKAVGMTSVVPATGGDSAASDAVMVKVADDPKLGKILVDSKGMTLYMFTKDEPDKSNCNAGCLVAWPPLTVKDQASAGEGVDAAMLGTATLADGSKIVTYNKMPLYYWAQDTKVGDVTGQGVNSVWYVVAPDGKPVKGETSTGY